MSVGYAAERARLWAPMERLSTPSFLRVTETEFDALSGEHDVLERLRRGRLTGVVVRGVYPPREAARAAERIATDAAGIEKIPLSPGAAPYSLGALMVTSPGGLEAYLDEAPRVAQLCERAFEGMAPVEPRLREVLSKLHAGRRVESPSHHDGRAYPLLSVRHVPAGTSLAAHCEKEQLHQRAYEELGPRLDGSTLLSFYLALNDSGHDDALQLFDLRVTGPMPHLTVQQKNKLRAALTKRRAHGIPVRAGDVVVFDGGRHYHRVAPSPNDRWTIGGFLSFSSSGEALAWT